MAEKIQSNRWRCLTTGCNPVMYGNEVAELHKDDSGHRVAKWPVRSAKGRKLARERNKSGYYNKYNVGAKSYENRGYRFDPDYDRNMAL